MISFFGTPPVSIYRHHWTKGWSAFVNIVSNNLSLFVWKRILLNEIWRNFKPCMQLKLIRATHFVMSITIVRQEFQAYHSVESFPLYYYPINIIAWVIEIRLIAAGSGHSTCCHSNQAAQALWGLMTTSWHLLSFVQIKVLSSKILIIQ